MTLAREFMRTLGRAPPRIKVLLQYLNHDEIAEADRVAWWMWSNSDHRRAMPKNIESFIGMAVRHVFDHRVRISPSSRYTLH